MNSPAAVAAAKVVNTLTKLLQTFLVKLNDMSTVKKVIGIVSGKGGVGKSLVTGLMASAMQRRGKQSAVLDDRYYRPLHGTHPGHYRQG